MDGVHEEAAEFRPDDAFAGRARFRQLGEFGPQHEVLSIRGDRVAIEKLKTGSRPTYPQPKLSRTPLQPDVRHGL